MKDKDYIASGLLESYALGQLSPEEAREVEQAARDNPAIQEALEEHQGSLEQLSQAYTVAPPPHLRKRILDAATGGDTAQGTSVNTGAASSQKPWAIAATIAFVLSGALNYQQYRRADALEQELQQKEFHLAEIREEKQVIAARYEQMEQYYELTRDPATVQLPMGPAEGRDANLLVHVLWNQRSEQVYLDIVSLPEAPEDKDYQLWALKDGKPIDMGVMEDLPDSEKLLALGSIAEADAFAVTLEPRGGSPAPTLEEMYVYGERPRT